jgi:hypothetical protein
MAHGVVRMAYIEREHSLAGNDVAHARLRRELTDGCYQAWSVTAKPFGGEDELGGSSQSIMAQMHWRRARMIGLAGKDKLKP